MNKKLYVLGFLFSEDKKNVALIKKTKPYWQAGLLNGIGGKAEAEDINTNNTMIREFREETGYEHKEWKFFTSMTNSQFIVECFVGYGDLSKLETTTEETVTIVEVKDILQLSMIDKKTIPNLSWLIPMALDSSDFKPVLVQYNEEEKYMEKK